MKPNMRVTRIYSGDDGKSHFQDIEVNFETPGVIDASKSSTATSLTFRRHDDDMDIDWHPAPVSQFQITIQGMVEIVASDGTTRIFGPGDIMWADDMTGEGHLTRGVKGHPRVFLSVPIARELLER